MNQALTHNQARRALLRWTKERDIGGETLDSMLATLATGERDGNTPYTCLYDALCAWDYCEVARLGKVIGLRIPSRLIGLTLEEKVVGP